MEKRGVVIEERGWVIGKVEKEWVKGLVEEEEEIVGGRLEGGVMEGMKEVGGVLGEGKMLVGEVVMG